MIQLCNKKIRSIIVLSLFFMQIGAAEKVYQLDAAHLLQQAQQCIQEYDFDKAYSCFQAVVHDTQDTAAHAKAHLEMGKLLFEESYELDFDDADYMCDDGDEHCACEDELDEEDREFAKQYQEERQREQNKKRCRDEAERHYRIAAEQNDDLSVSAQAYIKLGDLYYWYKRTLSGNRAIECYEMAANQTHDPLVRAKAHYELATIFASGLGAIEDTQRATGHFQYLIAQKDDPVKKAQGHFHFASMLENIHLLDEGNKFYGNIPEIIEHFQMAAEQKDSLEVRRDANLFLGRAYLARPDDLQDGQKAINCFTVVADQDEDLRHKAEAHAALGDMFYEGNGVCKDYRKAFHHYALSIKGEGDDWLTQWRSSLLEIWQLGKICLRLGHMSYFGHGTKLSRPKAAYYYLIAALCDPFPDSSNDIPVIKEAKRQLNKLQNLFM